MSIKGELELKTQGLLEVPTFRTAAGTIFNFQIPKRYPEIIFDEFRGPNFFAGLFRTGLHFTFVVTFYLLKLKFCNYTLLLRFKRRLYVRAL